MKLLVSRILKLRLSVMALLNMQHLVMEAQIPKQIVMACYLEILNLYIINTQAVQHLQQSIPMFHINME